MQLLYLCDFTVWSIDFANGRLKSGVGCIKLHDHNIFTRPVMKKEDQE